MKRSVVLLIAFIVVKLVLQYILLDPAYELQRDEYLHLDQGRHLAWGYISVPPVTSWIAYAIHLLGGSTFWVKLFPALFGCLTLVLVWKTVEKLGGGIFALLLAGTAFLVSPVLRINILFQPNTLDILAFTFVYYGLIRYVQAGRPRWLYITAIAAAFGFLGKYNIVFLLAGLLPALLLTTQRLIFRNKHLYFAAAIALIIVLPNLVWQYNNHFPTLRQLRELQETQLVNVHRADFLKDQVIYFIGSLFIIVAALAGFAVHKPFRQYRFVMLSFIFSLALFTLMKAKSYYAIGLYPVLMAFGSVYLERLFHTGRRRYLKPVALLLVIVLALPFILLSFPIKSPARLAGNLSWHKKLGLLRWEDGRDHHLPQDFADMLGWKELAAKADSAYAFISDRPHTLVLCDNYGEAGAINYYSRFRDIRAVSYNADYINWISLDVPIKNVVRIYEAGQAEEDMPKLKTAFDTVIAAGKIENKDAREYGTTVLLLQGPRVNVNTIIATDIRDRKKE